MPSGEVIDLSLSTDDEELPYQDLSGRNKTERSKRLCGPTIAILPDDSNDFVRLDSDLGEASTKRRRLSPSLYISDDGLIETEAGRKRNSPSVISQTGMRFVHSDESNEDANLVVIRSSPEYLSTFSPGTRNTSKLQSLQSESSDDSFPEDVMHNLIGHEKSLALSKRTAALLTRLEKPARKKKSAIGRQRSKDREVLEETTHSQDYIDKETIPKNLRHGAVGKSVKPTRLTDVDKRASAQEKESIRAANKAQKERNRMEEQERKRILKEEKVKEKERATTLAEVNKSRMDKKVTGPEMIVDLPASIDGAIVDTQTREFLKNLQIDATLYQSPLPNIVKWRRKVKSRYSEEKGHWEPVEPMEIEDEKHALCLMSATEFVTLASSTTEQGSLEIEVHVLNLKEKFKGYKLIYLIEGLATWMRKNKTSLNRAYQTAVLNQREREERNVLGGSQKSKPRRKQNIHEYVDEDIIEDALLRLQVINGCLVHHTTTTLETAEWVVIFTQHISTIPAKYSNHLTPVALNLVDIYIERSA